MFITEEERVILTRVLQRLLAGDSVPARGLTIRERRELMKKANDNGKTTENQAGS